MMEVIAGQVVELKCKVAGNPLPSFFWLKDGDMMSSTNLNFQVSCYIKVLGIHLCTEFFDDTYFLIEQDVFTSVNHIFLYT